MALQNPFVGYITRTYQQILQAVTDRFKIDLPEITDYSPQNPLITMLSVWGGIVEHLNYYIDQLVQELYLPTLRRFENAVKWATIVNYRVRGATAATGVVVFYVETNANTDILIPAGTVIQTLAGVQYYTTADCTILNGTKEITVEVRQAVIVPTTVLGTSNGVASQTFVLPKETEDNSVQVLVGATGWTIVDSFLFSYQNSEHYVVSQAVITSPTTQNVMQIKFGDGIKGKVPSVGQTISASYRTTQGSLGNVSPNQITEVVSTVPMPSGYVLKVRNDLSISGGTDAQTTTDLQNQIPLFIRTNDSARTRQDYIDTALLVSGVAAAGVVYECGKFVEIYVAPTGGGLASNTLLTAVEDYFEPRKMITTKVIAKSAGVVICKLEFDVNVKPNEVKSVVRDAVKQNLLDFFASKSTNIGGRINVSDLIATVENTAGVDFSDLVSFKTIPYARFLGSTPTELDWTKTLLNSTTTVQWKIKFTNLNKYQVLKDGASQGTFNIGQLFNDPIINFVVNQNYPLGSTWEFYTYPNNRNLLLKEPSAAIADSSDIILNMAGGI